MNFSRMQPFAVLAGALSIVAALYLGVPVQAAAQHQTARHSAGANNNAMKIEQRYMQLRGKLARTQQEAMKKNPHLVRDQKHFRKLLMDTMKRQGTDPKPQIAELNKLGKQIQNKHTSKAKRQNLIAKARKIQSTLMKAESKAARDPKVAAARKKLSQETIAAMRKINPKTDSMIAEMKAISKRMNNAHNAHQGG